MAFNGLIRVPALCPNSNSTGLRAYASVLHKYRFGPTKDGPYVVASQPQHRGLLRKRLDDGSVGDVPTEDIDFDAFYLVEVSIGTPPQKLRLIPDTGSADTWVWSTELPEEMQKKGRAAGKNIFSPAKSSSFRKLAGSTWSTKYGDQSTASGIVGTDTLYLGGLSVENQAIELAHTVSDMFLQDQGDGHLGLAFGNINAVKPKPVKTPVENMIEQRDIHKGAQLFTAYLGSAKDANEPDKGKSFFTFGYIDQEVLRAAGSDPHYVDVDSSAGFWKIPSASATINGKTVTRKPGNQAAVDSNTSLTLLDDATVEAIYAAIPGSKYSKENQGYIFPKSTTVDQLPVVTLAVGDKPFTFQKEDMTFDDADPGFVFGGIQSRGDLGFDLMGITFLKSIYAIFDQGNKRFGAVQRKEKEQNLAVN